jgi:hypothetical protein
MISEFPSYLCLESFNLMHAQPICLHGQFLVKIGVSACGIAQKYDSPYNN